MSGTVGQRRDQVAVRCELAGVPCNRTRQERRVILLAVEDPATGDFGVAMMRDHF